MSAKINIIYTNIDSKKFEEIITRIGTIFFLRFQNLIFFLCYNMFWNINAV